MHINISGIPMLDILAGGNNRLQIPYPELKNYILSMKQLYIHLVDEKCTEVKKLHILITYPGISAKNNSADLI